MNHPFRRSEAGLDWPPDMNELPGRCRLHIDAPSCNPNHAANFGRKRLNNVGE